MGGGGLQSQGEPTGITQTLAHGLPNQEGARASCLYIKLGRGHGGHGGRSDWKE